MPFKVKAVYDYSSPHEDDLQFPIGTIITVTDEEDPDWYGGEYIDDAGVKQEGIFPRNFVEKYEPTAPPRPTRARPPKKEPEAAPAPAPAPAAEEPSVPVPTSPKQAAPQPEPEEPAEEFKASSPRRASTQPLSPPAAPQPKAAEPVRSFSPPPPAPQQSEPPAQKAAPPSSKPGPPPVSEKPSSFKDRIAAFNKAAAPPIAPYKPAGLGSGSSGFVKKPFVAPPPSRNAYVPPPQNAPTAKVYRRDEDPEIKEREAENLETAEKAGLVPGGSNEAEGEDQPKPTSLKDRIALLQRQQMEQAQRHAEAAAKKEKPKRPPKKRTESHEPVEATEENEHVQPHPLERRDTEETGGKRSLDESHPPRQPAPPRRRASSKGVEPKDGNEADMSGAGDTTEDQGDLTEKEDSDERPRPVSRAPTSGPPPTEKTEEDEEAEEDEEEDEEDDDVDPEARRKEELRQRMAKMSGGMGMHGMFGPPGMMPMPGSAPAQPKKPKKASSEKRLSEDSGEVASPGGHAPPVPIMMGLPGMALPRRSSERIPIAEEPKPLTPGVEDEEDDEEVEPEMMAPPPDEEEEDEEVTEYEGDYDTDIASSAPHKDALKSHGRESSFEDTLSIRSPVTEAPPSIPPPVPSGAPPRAMPPPPPIPSQPPPDTRRSADVPRTAPPPPPPPKEAATPHYDDEDYDPFNYNAASPTPRAIPVMPGYSQPAPPPRRPSEDIYSPPEPSSSYQSPSDHRAPPAAPAPGRAQARHSMDAARQLGGGRRSLDVNRPSMESGFVANDIDLASQTGWWLQPNSLPPQLQGRKDIFFESEDSQSSKRGGKTTITRDIYVLFQDYSQTVITVRFDPQDSTDVHLEQRHEAPPRTLRQDQLEQSYERFGRTISEGVTSKKDTVVGDGTPQALVLELLKPLKDALLPVGTRAYGALVYSNLANASTTQNDEIRPGDIISIRNAKFQGKHGPMHAKYSMEVGKPDHVAVVAEWDGTKKKVRAWEQGRENKKVKQESYKLDDLRSGEVKIWRVMPRSWVGWEGQN
ncbi:putative sh3 domain-containing protein [Phaeoacremonium minimum UCRPA7]|uniref:Putative sh3 domain-containing protein n=1 Tax=Phaeoacremonium minimum (strain UCR-PA7) TaxID=1286976 RepID=R8BE12_PHAM7|nr:putative sh3 domain-containing protein [Phaeoacremonium minimum UCRPA7]EON97537.1 putative sh3 domain-containing protein [Phaeoacremonium minimum UCRPA7]